MSFPIFFPYGDFSEPLVFKLLAECRGQIRLLTTLVVLGLTQGQLQPGIPNWPKQAEKQLIQHPPGCGRCITNGLSYSPHQTNKQTNQSIGRRKAGDGVSTYLEVRLQLDCLE